MITWAISTDANLDIDSYDISSLIPAGTTSFPVKTTSYEVNNAIEWYINNVYIVKIKDCPAYAIGDRVYFDLNNDGTPDNDGEPGINGVTVELYAGSCPASGSAMRTKKIVGPGLSCGNTSSFAPSRRAGSHSLSTVLAGGTNDCA